eukprot:7229268-Pyramimonas_sp.AAC.1
MSSWRPGRESGSRHPSRRPCLTPWRTAPPSCSSKPARRGVSIEDRCPPVRDPGAIRRVASQFK